MWWTQLAVSVRHTPYASFAERYMRLIVSSVTMSEGGIKVERGVQRNQTSGFAEWL